MRASGEQQALIGTGRLLVRIDMDLPLGALTPHCNRQLDVASTNSAPPTSGGKCFDWFLWNSDVACNALGAPDGEIQGALPRTLMGYGALKPHGRMFLPRLGCEAVTHVMEVPT